VVWVLRLQYTRGSQKVPGNPLLTENERYDSECSDVVSLACLLAVTTGLVRFFGVQRCYCADLVRREC